MQQQYSNMTHVSVLFLLLLALFVTHVRQTGTTNQSNYINSGYVKYLINSDNVFFLDVVP